MANLDLQGNIQIQRQPLSVLSVRPFALQTLLLKRTPEQIVQFVALAYSLCGHAQKTAAQLVLNPQNADSIKSQNKYPVIVESLKEHYLSLLQLLNQLQLISPQQAAQAMQGVGQWVSTTVSLAATTPEPDLTQLANQIQQSFLKLGLCLSSVKTPYTDDSPFHSLNQYFAKDHYQNTLSTLGSLHAHPKSMSQWAPPQEAWNQWLQAPTLDNQPLENSAWTRVQQQQNTPLNLAQTQTLAQLLQQRLEAKILDAAWWWQQLQPEYTETKIFFIEQKAQQRFAWVETARGRLMHWAQCDAKGQTQAYAICAPTEWNFHPQGLMKQALAALPQDLDDNSWQQTATLIAQLIDPCVPLKFQSHLPETNLSKEARYA